MSKHLDHHDDGDLRAIIMLIPGFDPFEQADGCHFDAAAARRAIDFFPKMLKHCKGPIAGEPFVLSDWQKAVVANLFGWKRDGDGARRFREAFIYVAKKQGKSTFAAGILLYCLIADGEVGAELYSVAASMKQAGLVFEQAAGMVRQNPALNGKKGGCLKVYGAAGGAVQRSIVFPELGSYYKTMATDADTADGTSPHCVVVDEVHRHRTGELMDVLVKSSRARRQPVAIYTTTADYNRDSACNRLLRLGRLVRDNGGDKGKPGYLPHFLPVIYECSLEDVKDDGIEDPEVWRKANPNLGVTFTVETFREDLEKAKLVPEDWNNFLRLSLNIVTDSVVGWLPMDRWDQCEPELVGKTLPEIQAHYEAKVERLIASDRVCYGALDLSAAVDLTAFSLDFPAVLNVDDEIVEPHEVLSWAWIPEGTAAAKEKQDVAPYSVWRQCGFIEFTPGDAVDHRYVTQRILQIKAQYHGLVEVGFDPYMSEGIRQDLEEQGVPMIAVRQGGITLGAPSNKIQGDVTDCKLKHGGHPVLRWCASNASVRRDANDNIMPCKKRSAGRIDLIICLVMAQKCASFGGDPKQSLNDIYSEDPIYV